MDDELPLDAEDVRGVWANAFRAAMTPHELTIDFIRTDPFEPRAQIVARVSCSPLLLSELVDTLRDRWQDWTWRSES